MAWPLYVAVVVMVGVAGFAAFDAVRQDRADGRRGRVEVERTGSRTLPSSPEVAISASPPTAYRITYRLRDITGAERTVEWAVHRPFDSRSIERGEGYTTVDETAFTRAGSSGTRIRSSLFAVPPRPPDHRPQAVLADAVEAGLVEEREVREVAGTRCRVHRSSGTLDRFVAIDPGSYTDTCIDSRGLVLEEWQVDGGRPIRQRVATRVEAGTAAAARAAEPKLTGGDTVPTNLGGGDVKEVEPDSMPVGAFFVLDAPPPGGFVLRGRYAVVPSQPQLADPSRSQQDVIASTADVYVRDGTGDIVVVDQGGTLGRTTPFEPWPAAIDVDLGPELGAGEGLLGWSGAEVRVARDGGRFVRVYGTVPVDELASVARSLRRTEGGTGLVYV